jgi:hypothetical protein
MLPVCFPSLKKPAEAIGLNLNVPGAYWDGCAAADKKKIYVCTVRPAVRRAAQVRRRPAAIFACVRAAGDGREGQRQP